jgi:hypothetical protein
MQWLACRCHVRQCISTVSELGLGEILDYITKLMGGTISVMNWSHWDLTFLLFLEKNYFFG